MPRVTERMKIDAILDLAVQLGAPLPCVECQEALLPGQKIQFDHRQATVHDGAHTFKQIRPIHYDPCHKRKTKRDVQGRAKRDRIAKGGRKRKGRKLQGKGFPKKPDGYEYRWIEGE